MYDYHHVMSDEYILSSFHPQMISLMHKYFIPMNITQLI